MKLYYFEIWSKTELLDFSFVKLYRQISAWTRNSGQTEWGADSLSASRFFRFKHCSYWRKDEREKYHLNFSTQTYIHINSILNWIQICLASQPIWIVTYESIFNRLAVNGPFSHFGFLCSRSHHNWVNLKSSQWEGTTNIFFAFSNAQIAKGKNSTIVFSWLSV